MLINDNLSIKSAVFLPFTKITATYTVGANDVSIFVNNAAVAITITLPSASLNLGRIIQICRNTSTSTGTITIATTGGNVESITTFALGATTTIGTTAATRRTCFISDGINWLVLST